MQKLRKRVLSILLVFALMFGTVVMTPVRAAALAPNVVTRVADIVDGGKYMLRWAGSGDDYVYMNWNDYGFVTATLYNNENSQHAPTWQLQRYANTTDIFSPGFYPNTDANGSQIWMGNERPHRFQFVQMGDNSFQIRSESGQYCVGFNGTNVVLMPLANTSDRKWVLIKSTTVTYHPNGGAIASDGYSLGSGVGYFGFSSVINYDAFVAFDVLFPKATKAYTQFLGWNTDPNATEPLAFYRMPDHDVTLYAVYINVKTVTYNKNSGTSVSRNSSKAAVGTDMTLTIGGYLDDWILNATATKENARFLGWNTDKNATKPLTNFIMPNHDVTLFAIYEDQIPITYDYWTNGGASVTPATLPYGAFAYNSVNLSPRANKPGWEFLGWSTAQDATAPLNFYIMPANAPAPGITLYAIYQLDTTAKFVDYANSGQMKRNKIVTTYNLTVPTASTHTLTAPAQNVRSGWTALGWTHLQSANAAPIVSQNGGAVPFYTAYYGLYSHSVTLTYDANGGNYTPPAVSKPRFLNSYDITSPVNPIFALEFAPKKEKYMFAGWQNGDKLYAEGSNVSFGENTTLTALWDEIHVDNVALSCYNLTMGTGETARIEAFVTPADATNPAVTWSSSDKNVVKVDQSGNIEAIAEGAATITVTTIDGGKTANCAIIVEFIPVSVSGVAISDSEISIFVGDNHKLTGQVQPADATNQEISWSSSNQAVATVDQSGNVQGCGVGKATVTLTSANGKTAACIVTVRPISVTGIALSSDQFSMLLGDSAQLTATVSPANATDKRYTWTSSDSTIVSVDGSGKLTANRLGSANITVKTNDDGKISSCDVTVKPILVTGIALSDSKAELPIGGTKQLTATVSPANATDKTFVWKSSDPTIAFVDGNGKVTGLKLGTANITAIAADGNKKSSCLVMVVPVRVSKIELPSTMTIILEDIQQIQAAVLPANATDKTLTWQSSDSTIAGVDAKGRVTASQLGKATITVRSADGAASASCIVTVEPVHVTGISISETAISVHIGNAKHLCATVSPANATDKTYRWSSSDSNIASVNQSGEVTTKKLGKVTITAKATDGGKTASCSVTVTPVLVTNITLSTAALTLYKGQNVQLTASVYPVNATDKTYSWGSTDSSVASVSGGGVVTAHKLGTTNVIAAAKDGSGVRKTCEVTVLPILVNSIALSPSQTEIAVGERLSLAVTVKPDNAENKEVTFSSSNSDVASVDSSGKVTGLAAGSATVTALAKDGSGVKGQCVVVVKPVGVTGVAVSPEILILLKGQTSQLTATILPANVADKRVTWASSDEKIAKVDSNGLVTGKKTSDDPVTVTVATVEGGKKAECTVLVVSKDTMKKINEAGLDLSPSAEDSANASAGNNDVVQSVFDKVQNFIDFFLYVICFGWLWGYEPRVTGAKILSDDIERKTPKILFYNVNHDDHTTKLKAEIIPFFATNKSVTWSKERYGKSNNVLPILSSTTANPITVTPSETAVGKQFITTIQATTHNGCYQHQVVIGTERLPDPMVTYSAKNSAKAYRGPYSNDANFPSFKEFAAGDHIQVRAKYNADWYYAKWMEGSVETWGFVKLENFQLAPENPVTGVTIGAERTTPKTLYYNNTQHNDHTTKLTAVIAPPNATVKDVTWTATKYPGTNDATPVFDPGSSSNPVTVKPRSTAPGNQFVTTIQVKTVDGNETDTQVVIGVEYLSTFVTYKATKNTKAYRGPFSNDSNFPAFYTFSANEKIEVHGKYNANWYYATWGSRWGYVDIRDFAEVEAWERKADLPLGNFQGFAVGSTNCYTIQDITPKSSKDKDHEMYFNEMGTRKIDPMSSSSVGKLGHANDAVLVDLNGTKCIFVVDGQDGIKNMIKLEYNVDSNKKGTYKEVARYPFSDGIDYAGIAVLKKQTSKITFLLKKGFNFSTVDYDIDKQTLTSVNTNVFSINPGKSGETDKYKNYMPQSVYCDYNSHKIYAPMWGGGVSKPNENVILVYENIDENTRGLQTAKEAYIITKGNTNTKIEIEGCGFKGNTLWFNTNEGNSMKAEDKIPGGIYTDSGVKK